MMLLRRFPLLKYVITSVLLLTLIYLYIFRGNKSKEKKISAKSHNRHHHAGGYKLYVTFPNPDLHSDYGIATVDILVTFTRIKENTLFVPKFKTCLDSLLNYSSVHINLHLITDLASRSIASGVIDYVLLRRPSYVVPKVYFYFVDDIAKNVTDIVDILKPHFNYKPGSYYGETLFFLSTGLHLVGAFKDIKTLVIIDVDIQFKHDVKELYDYFHKFNPDAIFGMAYEQQPVYRHLLGSYRNKNPGTLIGDPPEKGSPGFNSGVMLMNLTRMRTSKVYNKYLTKDEITRVVRKFFFKGHLGDQDFYTLLNLEVSNLFYVLPCSWNRQLCQWWRNNGYSMEFDSYHDCKHPVKLYHGNCNSYIPND